MTSRHWCFTCFALLEPMPTHLDDKMDYCVYQYERCPTSGRVHIQGYAEYNQPVRYKKLQKWLKDETAHCETRRASREHARAYCMKMDTRLNIDIAPVELGRFYEKEQGKRTDYDDVRHDLQLGFGMQHIVNNYSYTAVRFAEKYLEYNIGPRETPPVVYWLHGPTGCGKTRWAIEHYPNAWMSMGNLKWWDGYVAQTEIIIDDFRGDFCTFHYLLRVLDRYPMRVEIKGGSRELRATTIIITSCHKPENVYNTREDVGQLLRRITHIIDMSQK